MIENTAAPADAGSGSGSIRPRYAPPNQRSRSLSRRKSGDHGSSGSRSHNNSSSSSPSFEGERDKQQQQPPPSATATRSSSTNTNPNTSNSNIITLQDCSRSQAAQLLSNRWSAAIQAYNDPSLPPSEKPVLYSGSGTSAWGQPRLSHQMDFLTELRRAMRDANASPDA